MLKRAMERGSLVLIPAAVLAQVWRDGARQAKLSALMDDEAVPIEALNRQQAQAIGVLCGQRSRSDIADTSVVLTARRYASIVGTSDPNDLLHLDPKLELVSIYQSGRDDRPGISRL